MACVVVMNDSPIVRRGNDMLATVPDLSRRGRLQEKVITRIAKMLVIKCHSSNLAVMLEVRHALRGLAEGFPPVVMTMSMIGQLKRAELRSECLKFMNTFNMGRSSWMLGWLGRKDEGGIHVEA